MSGVPEDEDPTKVTGGGRVLTISEVALLLEGLKTATEQRDPDAALDPVMRKTKDYVDRFRTAKSAAVVQQMRDMLIRYDLSDHDMGSLANLLPDDPDEARALIPSLELNPKLDDDTLQSLLLDLKSFVRIE
ncbi:hypothetical protein BSKO_04278 [Bryopsis sp. KO-2023]|nr:hypothetical protein BSKO_04278 [Bryopsis sp. KO-2023]